MHSSDELDSCRFSSSAINVDASIDMRAREEWLQSEGLKVEIRHLQKLIECPVCMEVLNTPVQLPCMHNFCHACIHEALNHNKICPLCQADTMKRQIEHVPTHIVTRIQKIADLIQSLNEEPSCEEYATKLMEEARKKESQQWKEKRRLRRGTDSISSSSNSANAAAGTDADTCLPAAKLQHVAEAQLQHDEQRAPITDTGERIRNEEHNRLIPCSSLDQQIPNSHDLSTATISTTDNNNISSEFKPGDEVEVADRCWVGINRPGGRAWVQHIKHETLSPQRKQLQQSESSSGSSSNLEHSPFDGPFYTVRYVLDGRTDKDIPAFFVRNVPKEQESRPRRSRIIQNTHNDTKVKKMVVDSSSSSSMRKKRPLGDSTNQKHAHTEHDIAPTVSNGEIKQSAQDMETTTMHGSTISKKTKLEHSLEENISYKSLTHIPSTSEFLPVTKVTVSTSEPKEMIENTDWLTADEATKVNGPMDKFLQITTKERKKSNKKITMKTNKAKIGTSTTVTYNASCREIDTSTSPIYILCTNLDDKDDGYKASFMQHFNNKGIVCIEEQNFSSKVTHLIGGTMKEKSKSTNSAATKYLLKTRTMKFLLSLMHGIPILSADWLKECVSRDQIIPPSHYEVIGVHKKSKLLHRMSVARTDIAKYKHSRLFSGIRVWLAGMFPLPGPAKSDLQELLATGGAKLSMSAKELLRHISPAAVTNHGKKNNMMSKLGLTSSGATDKVQNSNQAAHLTIFAGMNSPESSRDSFHSTVSASHPSHGLSHNIVVLNEADVTIEQMRLNPIHSELFTAIDNGDVHIRSFLWVLNAVTDYNYSI